MDRSFRPARSQSPRNQGQRPPGRGVGSQNAFGNAELLRRMNGQREGAPSSPREQPSQQSAAAQNTSTEQEVEQTSTADQTKAIGQTDTTGQEAAQTDNAADRAVTDSYALLRTPPPELASTTNTIPVGTLVNILETTEKDGEEYVRVAEFEGEGEELGWTKKSNLGSAKEFDTSMEAEQAISLDGLSGLDRTMAVIHNTRGAFLNEQATALQIAEEDAAAVLQAESQGKGFSDDDRMIIRFENHKFFKYWGESNPTEFAKYFKYNASKTWTGHYWRSSETDAWSSFHNDQSKEWEVFEFARALDENAAMMSISMGAAQVMGFNFSTAGFTSVEEMFEQMNGGIKPQLDGMFEFIENNATALSGLRAGNYTQFAGAYNGSGQADAYGSIIESASNAYVRVKNTLDDS